MSGIAITPKPTYPPKVEPAPPEEQKWGNYRYQLSELKTVMEEFGINGESEQARRLVLGKAENLINRPILEEGIDGDNEITRRELEHAARLVAKEFDGRSFIDGSCCTNNNSPTYNL